VCSGFIQGLRLVCEVLVARGERAIAFEDPCLADHRAVARAAGLAVIPLPVDEHGARDDALPARGVGAVVLTPAHQAVLGGTTSPERRAAFARWARATGGYVIEDDYDAEFRYERQPVGALQALAPDRVVYAGSASKTLAPGLRLGWLVVPPGLLDDVVERKRRADRGTAITEQIALAELIASGAMDRHVRAIRSRYRRRRDALVALLGRALPGARVVGIAAGLHLAAILPDGGEAAIVDAAAADSIALTGLESFWHAPPGPVSGLAIGYAAPPEHAYAEALRRLEQLLSGARA
jgi:GntR family transcriptional regulator/MocR family aminotransferase